MGAVLEQLSSTTAVETSFGEGSDVVAELTLVSLSNHSLDKAAQTYGQEAQEAAALVIKNHPTAICRQAPPFGNEACQPP